MPFSIVLVWGSWRGNHILFMSLGMSTLHGITRRIELDKKLLTQHFLTLQKYLLTV